MVLIEEVEAMGGMTKAVNDGLPKRLIEAAATKRQAAIDLGDLRFLAVGVFTSASVATAAATGPALLSSAISNSLL
ncbi:hypothetical protein LCM4579_24790 [Ensifer sp. LCM 4579]|nr:hypothetical protein LCM4579_24790 [Ensifer sp. LCM 4579]